MPSLHALIQMINKLFLSTLSWYKNQLEVAVARCEWLAAEEHKGQAVPPGFRDGSHGVRGCDQRAVAQLEEIWQRGEFERAQAGHGAAAVARCLLTRSTGRITFASNAAFDISRNKFVNLSKYDFCLTTAASGSVGAARKGQGGATVRVILPDAELRKGYCSVLKSGFSGTRPENLCQ